MPSYPLVSLPCNVQAHKHAHTVHKQTFLEQSGAVVGRERERESLAAAGGAGAAATVGANVVMSLIFFTLSELPSLHLCSLRLPPFTKTSLTDWFDRAVGACTCSPLYNCGDVCTCLQAHAKEKKIML